MILLVSAPSGAGKGTIIKQVLERNPLLSLARSWTTRPIKEGEVDGVDYDFVTTQEFLRMENAGGFAEAEVVHGNLYGTPIKELTKGRDVIVEVDYKGATKIKKMLPRVSSIFYLPPSYAELERRIRGRNREKTEEEIALRLQNALTEIRQAATFDFWIVNDDLDQAVKDTLKLMIYLRSDRCRTPPSYRNDDLLNRIQGTFFFA